MCEKEFITKVWNGDDKALMVRPFAEIMSMKMMQQIAAEDCKNCKNAAPYYNNEFFDKDIQTFLFQTKWNSNSNSSRIL